MECNCCSALVGDDGSTGGAGLQDRLNRYHSKGLDCVESKLYLAGDPPCTFLIGDYKLYVDISHAK